MKIDEANFQQLVERAMRSGDTPSNRPVIEKELLHYDILYCLDQAGLLNELVFQGGTCLRLCYGANRFSEDLDFAGGANYSTAHLMEMKACIENYIGKRYGLEVHVKEPSALKQETPYQEIKVDKWQITIITAPERKDIARQRIKIEVANIPAYTRIPLPLKKNYDFLPDGYEDTLILTETLDEIMADKLVSLPATQRYVRHRDLWDLLWLQQQGAKVDASLVGMKIEDYRIEGFKQKLQERRDSLNTVIAGKAFFDEMKRFLPTPVFDRTLAQEKFKAYQLHELEAMLAKLSHALYTRSDATPPFQL